MFQLHHLQSVAKCKMRRCQILYCYTQVVVATGVAPLLPSTCIGCYIWFSILLGNGSRCKRGVLSIATSNIWLPYLDHVLPHLLLCCNSLAIPLPLVMFRWFFLPPVFCCYNIYCNTKWNADNLCCNTLADSFKQQLCTITSIKPKQALFVQIIHGTIQC